MLRTFFTYGTLMTNCVNHHVIGNKAIERIEVAKVTGMELYMVKGAYYPAIIEGTGDVIGELITIRETYVDDILKRVDRLEGYVGEGREDNLYDRVVVQAETATGSKVLAYCYIYHLKYDSLGEKIEHGNFKRHMEVTSYEA